MHSTMKDYAAEKSGLVTIRNGRNLVDTYRGQNYFSRSWQHGKDHRVWRRIIRNNDRAPKYINTPENEIYSKSKILYGTYFARQAIDRAMNVCWSKGIPM